MFLALEFIFMGHNKVKEMDFPLLVMMHLKMSMHKIFKNLESVLLFLFLHSLITLDSSYFLDFSATILIAVNY
jgi:hypothetical protein